MSDSLTISLSRQISFSCGLRLHQDLWDEQMNFEVYDKRSRPHGANFQLRIALRGSVSPDDGMIVNLIDVKPHLNQLIYPLDNCFLNDDVAYFSHCSPTPENLARYLWDKMPANIGNGSLYRLQLQQLNHTTIEISLSSMKVSRFYEFAAAHRLFTPTLSSDENWARFDKCSNPAGHGHNFQLSVWVEGAPEAQSGFIINPQLLDDIVEQEVYQRFDHRHLNEDCKEFFGNGLVPTSENLALVIFKLMQDRLSKEGYRLSKIGLQETQKNYFEVEA